jgi:hypothetical protein
MAATASLCINWLHLQIEERMALTAEWTNRIIEIFWLYHLPSLHSLLEHPLAFESSEKVLFEDTQQDPLAIGE